MFTIKRLLFYFLYNIIMLLGIRRVSRTNDMHSVSSIFAVQFILIISLAVHVKSSEYESVNLTWALLIWNYNTLVLILGVVGLECLVDQPCRVEIENDMAVPGELKTRMFT